MIAEVSCGGWGLTPGETAAGVGALVGVGINEKKPRLFIPSLLYTARQSLSLVFGTDSRAGRGWGASR